LSIRTGDPLVTPNEKQSADDRDRLWLPFYRVVRATIRVMMRLYCRIRVRGLENLPREGPVVVAANHASLLDPPAVGVMLTRPLHYLAKQELFSIPLFGRAIAALGSLPVARGGADRNAIREMTRVLERGECILIFPEGTRTHDGRLQEAKGGVGWIALQIPDAWILPVYIEGTYGSWSRHRKLPRPGRVTVHVGEPVKTSALVQVIESRLSDTPSKTGSETGEISRPTAPGPMPKKRLYWELANEIMSRIAKVQRGMSRSNPEDL
jgi:1-acyl-sn-glycerol-3-phosphate acyltransferase